ncbi:hypothetical protein HDU96_000798 [Phlyctochytrium bullatum]|nr:hypothetical protein HDU96_000798 [Phlyctochytrium bullatum]
MLSTTTTTTTTTTTITDDLSPHQPQPQPSMMMMMMMPSPPSSPSPPLGDTSSNAQGHGLCRDAIIIGREEDVAGISLFASPPCFAVPYSDFSPLPFATLEEAATLLEASTSTSTDSLLASTSTASSTISSTGLHSPVTAAITTTESPLHVTASPSLASLVSEGCHRISASSNTTNTTPHNASLNNISDRSLDRRSMTTPLADKDGLMLGMTAAAAEGASAGGNSSSGGLMSPPPSPSSGAQDAQVAVAAVAAEPLAASSAAPLPVSPSCSPSITPATEQAPGDPPPEATSEMAPPPNPSPEQPPPSPAMLPHLPRELAQEISLYLHPNALIPLTSASRASRTTFTFNDDVHFAKRHLMHQFGVEPRSLNKLREVRFGQLAQAYGLAVIAVHGLTKDVARVLLPDFAGEEELWRRPSRDPATAIGLLMRATELKLFDPTGPPEPFFGFTLAAQLDSLGLVYALMAMPSSLVLGQGEAADFIAMETLLFAACREGARDVLGYVLAMGVVDPSTGNETALKLASEHGHAEAVRMLLATGAVDPTAQSNMALRKAAEEGHREVLEVLLETGMVTADCNDSLAVRLAAEHHHLDLLEFLLERGDVDPTARDNEAFAGACARGYIDVMRRLLNVGVVNFTEPNGRPLINAAFNNHSDAVRFLLERHAAACGVTFYPCIRTLDMPRQRLRAPLPDEEDVDGEAVPMPKFSRGTFRFRARKADEGTPMAALRRAVKELPDLALLELVHVVEGTKPHAEFGPAWAFGADVVLHEAIMARVGGRICELVERHLGAAWNGLEALRGLVPAAGDGVVATTEPEPAIVEGPTVVLGLPREEFVAANEVVGAAAGPHFEPRILRKALMKAIGSEAVGVVKVFLDDCWPVLPGGVNGDEGAVLRMAVDEGDVATVKVVIEMGAFCNRWPAAWREKTEEEKAPVEAAAAEVAAAAAESADAAATTAAEPVAAATTAAEPVAAATTAAEPVAAVAPSAEPSAAPVANGDVTETFAPQPAAETAVEPAPEAAAGAAPEVAAEPAPEAAAEPAPAPEVPVAQPAADGAVEPLPAAAAAADDDDNDEDFDESDSESESSDGSTVSDDSSSSSTDKTVPPLLLALIGRHYEIAEALIDVGGALVSRKALDFAITDGHGRKIMAVFRALVQQAVQDAECDRCDALVDTLSSSDPSSPDLVAKILAVKRERMALSILGMDAVELISLAWNGANASGDGDMKAAMEKMLCEDVFGSYRVEREEVAVAFALERGFPTLAKFLALPQPVVPKPEEDGAPVEQGAAKPPRVDFAKVPKSVAVVTLHRAAEYDCLEIMEMLLGLGVDPSVDDEFALRSACSAGHKRVVKCLLDSGKVDPSFDDSIALREACQFGHLETVKLLLADGRASPAAYGGAALELAMENEHDEVAKALLVSGKMGVEATISAARDERFGGSFMDNILDLFYLDEEDGGRAGEAEKQIAEPVQVTEPVPPSEEEGERSAEEGETSAPEKTSTKLYLMEVSDKELPLIIISAVELRRSELIKMIRRSARRRSDPKILALCDLFGYITAAIMFDDDDVETMALFAEGGLSDLSLVFAENPTTFVAALKVVRGVVGVQVDCTTLDQIETQFDHVRLAQGVLSLLYLSGLVGTQTSVNRFILQQLVPRVPPKEWETFASTVFTQWPPTQLVLTFFSDIYRMALVGVEDPEAAVPLAVAPWMKLVPAQVQLEWLMLSVKGLLSRPCNLEILNAFLDRMAHLEPLAFTTLTLGGQASTDDAAPAEPQPPAEPFQPVVGLLGPAAGNSTEAFEAVLSRYGGRAPTVADGSNALVAAVAALNSELAREILRKGLAEGWVDPGHNDDEALQKAAWNSMDEVTEALIATGKVDPMNARSDPFGVHLMDVFGE